MEKNTLEDMRKLFGQCKEAMESVEERNALREEVTRLKELVDKNVKGYDEYVENVNSHTKNMEDQMFALEGLIKSMYESLAIVNAQQNASELRRKKELSVFRETIKIIGRDMGNVMQMMESLPERVEGVNVMLLKMENEVGDVSSTG